MKERVSAMLTQIDNSDRPMVVQIDAVGRWSSDRDRFIA